MSGELHLIVTKAIHFFIDKKVQTLKSFYASIRNDQIQGHIILDCLSVVNFNLTFEPVEVETSYLACILN